MITNTPSHEFISRKDNTHVIIVRYEPEEKTQGDSIFSPRRLSKWFGLLSTIALGAAAFAPDIFNVPLHFRPWFFITFIFWFFAFCAGVFNL
jgi:hypothetical protein